MLWKSQVKGKIKMVSNQIKSNTRSKRIQIIQLCLQQDTIDLERLESHRVQHRDKMSHLSSFGNKNVKIISRRSKSKRVRVWMCKKCRNIGRKRSTKWDSRRIRSWRITKNISRDRRDLKNQNYSRIRPTIERIIPLKTDILKMI